MLSNNKVINVLGYRKEEVVTTPLSENKSPTNKVEEGTDKLSDMPLMEQISSTKDV